MQQVLIIFCHKASTYAQRNCDKGKVKSDVRQSPHKMEVVRDG